MCVTLIHIDSVFIFLSRGTCLAAENEQNDGVCITIVVLSWFVQS